MKTWIASSGLWAVAILKSLLCLSAGALQESRGCSIYQNTAFRVFFNRLTTCTYWTAQWLGHCWRGLTQTELADWQYESGNTNTDLKLTQTAATQYIRSTLPTNSTLLRLPCVDDGRTAASSAAVSWLHHMRNICYLRDSSFKKLSNQNSIDIPMQTSKALFVANSKISTNAHLVRICLKMGVKGMFCSSKLQVK